MATTVSFSLPPPSPSPSSSPSSSLSHMMDKLWKVSASKRVSEFFKDYDPLRSGYISKLQFRRCLDQYLDVKLSEDDFLFLCGKFEDKPGRVNYRSFCEHLENVFKPQLLDGRPEKQLQRSFGAEGKTQQPGVPMDTLQLTDKIIDKCVGYYKYNGINVRTCYKDFDRHHRGYITETQFHRSFPGPVDVTPEEIQALAQRYSDDPSLSAGGGAGLVNYLRFHGDVLAAMERGEREGEGTYHTPPGLPKLRSPSLEEIFQKIRIAVFKNGIRTTEFFRDHDKLRSGVITENQFMCGLSLCCGREAGLSREEVQSVAQCYRTEEGRVCYKQFCDSMENVFNCPDFERMPTHTVYRPPRGHLYVAKPHPPPLTPGEEARLEQVLDGLRKEVKRRRLMLYPYFKDFDRAGEGDVDYSTFIQSIDEGYTGHLLESQEGNSCDPGVNPSSPPSPAHCCTMEEVSGFLDALGQHLGINGIRTCEGFQDADPLRCGSITMARFRQGLSSLGYPAIPNAMFDALCQCYADPKLTGFVRWKDFVSDVENKFGHTQSATNNSGHRGAVWDRGRDRGRGVGPLGSPGEQQGKQQQEEEEQALEQALGRLAERTRLRGLLPKPVFQDFDRQNIGYVTGTQFRQCLSHLDLPVSEGEGSLMEARFSDAQGFHFPSFLERLQPSQPTEDKYKTRMAIASSCATGAGAVTGMVNKSKPVDVQQVMEKIKTKVSRERVRVLEFMRDYDKLRSGGIRAESFRRALDLCGFGLSVGEVEAIVERYKSQKDSSLVDYVRFSNEIEAIFTTSGLEKNPTAHVSQYVPARAVLTNSLQEQDQLVFQTAMQKLAEKAGKRRIPLVSLFQDYDPVNTGTVSRSQFLRVLDELSLGLLTGPEASAVFLRFRACLGGREDVCYRAFCQSLEQFSEDLYQTAMLTWH